MRQNIGPAATAPFPLPHRIASSVEGELDFLRRIALRVTRDASGVTRLYVDGVEVGVRATTGDLSTWVEDQRFVIGADSTIGHNVTLGDCTIGARTLIGIGSVVANDTVIEDEVFLAAGAETLEGQVLESGWLWGKRPAVKIAPLDAVKRETMAVIPPLYMGYAREFDAAQRAD